MVSQAIVVYASYRRFAQCDDGGIGEGYSDSVARLLADKWESTGELNNLASGGKGFRQFVLRHVDELMSPTQAEAIGRNATERCKPNARVLCKSITARLSAFEKK